MSTRAAKDTLWNAMGDFQHNGEEVKVSVKPVMDLHLCLDRLSGLGFLLGVFWWKKYGGSPVVTMGCKTKIKV